jgi:hypothetical protein
MQNVWDKSVAAEKYMVKPASAHRLLALYRREEQGRPFAVMDRLLAGKRGAPRRSALSDRMKASMQSAAAFFYVTVITQSGTRKGR